MRVAAMAFLGVLVTVWSVEEIGLIINLVRNW